jgi:hypothetical protein
MKDAAMARQVNFMAGSREIRPQDFNHTDNLLHLFVTQLIDGPVKFSFGCHRAISFEAYCRLIPAFCASWSCKERNASRNTSLAEV